MARGAAEKKEPKPETKPQFIPMPPKFVEACKAIIMVAQREANVALAKKCQTVRELRADTPGAIPDDWHFEIERGGFVPPKGGG